jgi:hypothetical protein
VEEKVLEGEKLLLRVPEKDSEAVCDGERDMDVEAEESVGEGVAEILGEPDPVRLAEKVLEGERLKVPE